MTLRPLPALFATLLCAAVPMAIVHAQAPANKPAIAFEKQVLDLGKVPVGARVEGAFAASNPGNRKLEITEVSTDCKPCVTLYDKLDEPMVVDPGATEEIRFLLQGTKTPGPVNVTLTVRSNAANQPRATLKIKANVVSATGKPGG